jgi:hypothetical protein
MSKPRGTSDEPAVTGSKQIGLRVPADLNQQLELIARRECNGVSAVCRRLIRQGLRDEHTIHPDGEAK